MEKFSRNQRVSAITKTLIECPNKVINLNYFTELFNAAKSTISEDLVIVRDLMDKLGYGKVETIAGASGGVKYSFSISEEKINMFVKKLCLILQEKDRIIPGNFIYMTDIMCNPEILHVAGLTLASKFVGLDVDYVVTVETKGIPLAYEVARLLGKQLVIVRRDAKVTEGATVTINYVTGSLKRIQSMSLSRKCMNKGSKCIFIDDFMKAGGTALGIIDLLKEFESELLGIGVLVDNTENPEKVVHDYHSILDFKGIDNDGSAIVVPSIC
ncbi:pur operon repressor [Clostridium felsineum]|uniref:Pur operon repressor n=1 Tax=Clostridium felsineum TaxID=36839 RepID=A0A1S8LG16_9CLOT|nr:pur operon repressor [Clostridium felsineum]MCR3760809.1 pur operon repressor [Clostridium felsineum]URZ03369.1 Pur operon repressor [Clostridium felsineum]URZ08313.1 Pur operon repressor [Clostridium felsineum]URZ13344.1 Pur operon repressor [Clostridium felsineum]URZ14675.1 Pur operon repressor [Clostridium felsineum DSM 794]